MTTALYDTFTGSAGALSSHTSDSGHTWINPLTTNNGSAFALDGAGKALITDPNTGRAGSAFSSFAPPSANYGVGGKLIIRSSDVRQAALGIRAVNTPGDSTIGYFGGYDQTTGGWTIWKGTLGSFFGIISSTTPYTPPSYPDPHDLWLTVSGSSTTVITLYVDGVSTVAFSDSSSPITAAGTVALRDFSPSSDGTHGTAWDTIVTAPQASTLSGPTAGTVGVASSNFGLTLEVPYYNDGTVVTVTPTGAGLGGSFSSPATIPHGQTSTTWTYTAAVAETDSIGCTTALSTTVGGAPITFVASAASATAFTLAGPSSGFIHNASTNFTFQPNGLYTGTITPTMTGLAGTWSPTSLSWTASNTAKTAVFTPSAVGSGNANGTGSPSLTQPANVAYASVAQTLAVSPSALQTSAGGTLSFTGGGTLWTTSAPTFGPTGVSGFSLGSITVVSATSATAPYTTSTGVGTETFTDSTTSAATTATVAVQVIWTTSADFPSVPGQTPKYTVFPAGSSASSTPYQARGNTGVLQLGSGPNYQATFLAQPGAEYRVIWDDGSGSPFSFATDVPTTADVQATLSNPWNADLTGSFASGTAGQFLASLYDGSTDYADAFPQATVSAATSASSFTLMFNSDMTAANLVGWGVDLGIQLASPSYQLITMAVQVNATTIVVTFSAGFSATPTVGSTVVLSPPSSLAVDGSGRVTLAPTGLDAIIPAEPDTTTDGPMTGWNFRKLLRWGVMALAGGTRTLASGSGTLTVKKLSGSTSTQQAIGDDGAGNETLGAPT